MVEAARGACARQADAGTGQGCRIALARTAPLPRVRDMLRGADRMHLISRRDMLVGGLAVTGLTVAGLAGRAKHTLASNAAPDLVIGTRVIEVRGKPAKVFGLTQS